MTGTHALQAGVRKPRSNCLCDRVREVCPDFPGQPETIDWSIPDPAARHDDDEPDHPAFQQTAAEPETRLLATLINRNYPGTTTPQEER